MKFIRLPLLLALSFSAAAPALAQDGLANRFTMQKTENGFVRMDTQTGEMSMCAETDGEIVCKMAADERHAFEDQLARLSARVAALEKKAAGDDLQPSMIAPPDSALPDDAEIERTLGVMEKMMRRFFGMVDEMRKDFDKDAAPREPAPDHT